MRFLLAAIFALVLILTAEAASAAENKIVTSSLSDLALDSIGTLDSKNGGLSEDMWYGSEGKTIISLLDALPSATHSQAMKRLMTRLLLTKARPPVNMPENAFLFERRIGHLMQMGKGKELSALLKLLPEEKRNEQVEQTEVATLLYAKEYSAACPKVATALQKFNTPFWQRANILCLAVQNKKNEAELAIGLLEELTGKPAVIECCNIPYRSLLELIPPREGVTKPLPAITPSNMLELPLLLAAGFSFEEKNEKQRELNTALLHPMLVTGNDNRVFWHPERIDSWWRISEKMPEGIKTKYAIRSFVLMEAMGMRLPATAWEPLSLKDIPSPEPNSPLAAILQRLDKAAREKKQGEAVLLGMIALGEEGPSKARAYTAARVVRALKRVGLEKAANDIAAEAIYYYDPNTAL